MLKERGLGAFDISVIFINFGDSDDKRDLRFANSAKRVQSLGHYTLVCGHHKDRDVCCRGAARAECFKSLVTRRIEEGDLATVMLRDIGRDVLGNATCFTGHDISLTNVVEEGGL